MRWVVLVDGNKREKRLGGMGMGREGLHGGVGACGACYFGAGDGLNGYSGCEGGGEGREDEGGDIHDCVFSSLQKVVGIKRRCLTKMPAGRKYV